MKEYEKAQCMEQITPEFVLILVGEFVEERRDRFPEITPDQVRRWAKRVYSHILNLFGDSDIYYDFMPDDIEEIHVVGERATGY